MKTKTWISILLLDKTRPALNLLLVAVRSRHSVQQGPKTLDLPILLEVFLPIMFAWLFGESKIELPEESREFDFYLYANAPPAASPCSLEYDVDDVEEKQETTIQALFDPVAYKTNLLWFQFHHSVSNNLSSL